MHGKGFVFATVLLGVMAVVLTTLAYFRGDGAHIEGLKSAFRLTLNILPLIFFAMIIGGMIQILIPKDLIMHWIGSGSGVRGVVIGSLAGVITPGAPYVSYPIAAALIQSGAGIPTIISFVTSWSLLSATKIPMELGILGINFTVFRLICTFLFPFIAGIVALLIKNLIR